MKPKARNDRKNYRRMMSRHPRLTLGYDRYDALYRNTEVHCNRGPGNRFERRAWELFGLAWSRLWAVDPTVFYQSPFIAQPIRDEE